MDAGRQHSKVSHQEVPTRGSSGCNGVLGSQVPLCRCVRFCICLNMLSFLLARKGDKVACVYFVNRVSLSLHSSIVECMPFIFTLQMQKLSTRDGKSPAQIHKASEGQSWDQDSGSLSYHSVHSSVRLGPPRGRCQDGIKCTKIF